MADRAVLMIAASESDSNLYYATRFIAPDPFVFAEIKGERVMLMSDLEVDRARGQATVDRVLSYADYERRAREAGVQQPSTIDVVHVLLAESGVRRLLLPADFSFKHARRLEQLGYQLQVGPEPFFEHRAVKTEEEVSCIEATQRATETAVAAAFAMLATASDRNGTLWLNDEPITSERMKQVINVQLMERDCVAQHTIVAGGDQACDPHHEGKGPLPAHQSIIFDVFPRSGSTRYFADMARTVVRGRPSVNLKRLYRTVQDAQEEAIARIKDGADGAKIHRGICDRFEAAGYRTGVMNGRMQGFFHGTGHGVGLDIHEAPRISKTGSILQEGHVVTVEPGLYYPGLGAVRIEDMVLVTRDGCRNLTTFPKVLELE